MFKEWRCFFCDQVFTDEAKAREHFQSLRDSTDTYAGAHRRGQVEMAQRYVEHNVVGRLVTTFLPPLKYTPPEPSTCVCSIRRQS
jgi:hypothetical protein